MPAVTLPHPLRPPVPAPVTAPASFDATLIVAVLILLAVIAVGWWWLRRQEPRRRPTRTVAPATWQELDAAVGSADWYERFGQRVSAMNGYSGSDHHQTARLLSALANSEVGRPWLGVIRRWEWAIYAAHPGTPAEHRADLQLAKARWP